MDVPFSVLESDFTDVARDGSFALARTQEELDLGWTRAGLDLPVAQLGPDELILIVTLQSSPDCRTTVEDVALVDRTVLAVSFDTARDPQGCPLALVVEAYALLIDVSRLNVELDTCCDVRIAGVNALPLGG